MVAIEPIDFEKGLIAPIASLNPTYVVIVVVVADFSTYFRGPLN